MTDKIKLFQIKKFINESFIDEECRSKNNRYYILDNSSLDDINEPLSNSLGKAEINDIGINTLLIFFNENNCGKYGLCKTLEEAADEQTEIFIKKNHYKEDAKTIELQKNDKIYRKKNSNKDVSRAELYKINENRLLRKSTLINEMNEMFEYCTIKEIPNGIVSIMETWFGINISKNDNLDNKEKVRIFEELKLARLLFAIEQCFGSKNLYNIILQHNFKFFFDGKNIDLDKIVILIEALSKSLKNKDYIIKIYNSVDQIVRELLSCTEKLIEINIKNCLNENVDNRFIEIREAINKCELLDEDKESSFGVIENAYLKVFFTIIYKYINENSQIFINNIVDEEQQSIKCAVDRFKRVENKFHDKKFFSIKTKDDIRRFLDNNADYINEIVFNNKKNSYNFRRQLLNRVDFYFDTFNEFGHDNTNVDIIMAIIINDFSIKNINNYNVFKTNSKPISLKMALYNKPDLYYSSYFKLLFIDTFLQMQKNYKEYLITKEIKILLNKKIIEFLMFGKEECPKNIKFLLDIKKILNKVCL